MNDAHLRWLCRRSLLELDVLFTRYYEQNYHKLNKEDKAALLELLQLEDCRILEMLHSQDFSQHPILKSVTQSYAVAKRRD